MSDWQMTSGDGFIKLDGGWVRMSRIESIRPETKRWGVTASGKDLYRVTVTLISGAEFHHLTSDVERLVESALRGAV